MTRRRLVWLGAGVAVAALVVGALTFGQRDPGDGTGSPRGRAQAIELPRLDGPGSVSLGALRGRPVVVNFFASWCVPCRNELPGFQAVSRRLGDRVAFLGVNHQDNRQGGLQLLADTGVTFPSGYDPDGKVAESYALFGMPTTLFVSADGRLLEKHTGELSESKLEEMVSRLFS